MGHDTQNVPLHADRTCDVNRCHGYLSGTHFITMQVNRFVEEGVALVTVCEDRSAYPAGADVDL